MVAVIKDGTPGVIVVVPAILMVGVTAGFTVAIGRIACKATTGRCCQDHPNLRIIGNAGAAECITVGSGIAAIHLPLVGWATAGILGCGNKCSVGTRTNSVKWGIDTYSWCKQRLYRHRNDIAGCVNRMNTPRISSHDDLYCS